MALLDNIISAESGGNRYAKNPRSSAYGTGQFINSTWLDMIKKYRPELMQGRSVKEILDLRSDPELSRQMTDFYAKENQSLLKSRGFEVNDTNTYLSHFLGPGGASKVLSNPDRRAEDVLSEDTISSNPFLKGMTGRDVINFAAGKVGGQKTPVAGMKDTTKPETKAQDGLLSSLFSNDLTSAYKTGGLTGALSSFGLGDNTSSLKPLADMASGNIGKTLSSAAGSFLGIPGLSLGGTSSSGTEESDKASMKAAQQAAQMNEQALAGMMQAAQQQSNPGLMQLAQLVQQSQQGKLGTYY